MLNPLVLIILVATVYGDILPDFPQVARDWDRNGKIVGGEDADIREAPYQAAMLLRSNTIFRQSCGGSIIRADVIACAAHCDYGTLNANWRVRVGSTFSESGGQLFEVIRKVMHFDYEPRTIDYDISLFFLNSSIDIDGSSTNIVPLPVQNAFIADGAPAFVTGWGSTMEGGSIVPNLQKIIIPIINQQVCANAYSGFNTITSRMICAGNLQSGGEDACQGDSGGPLTVDGILIGITSWGRGCARPGYPGVWTRVPYFRDWIDRQLG